MSDMPDRIYVDPHFEDIIDGAYDRTATTAATTKTTHCTVEYVHARLLAEKEAEVAAAAELLRLVGELARADHDEDEQAAIAALLAAARKMKEQP